MHHRVPKEGVPVMTLPRLDLSEARQRLVELDRLDAELERLGEHRERLQARHYELVREREPLQGAKRSVVDVTKRRTATADELLAGKRTGGPAIASKSVAEIGRQNAQAEIELADVNHDIATLSTAIADTEASIREHSSNREAAHCAFLEALRSALIEYHGALGDHMVQTALRPLYGLKAEMDAAGMLSDPLRGMLESSHVRHWRTGRMELLWPSDGVGRRANAAIDAEAEMAGLVEYVREAG